MAILDPLRQEFRRRFGAEPRVFRAPGRVNLIGGHTDYNEGWVLPLAIDRDCFVLASARADGRLRIHSREFDETAEAGLDFGAPGEHHWSRYVLGVAWALGEIGVSIAGADLLVASDVPHGGGLSSSAALEVSTAFALAGLASVSPDRAALARACQRAENEFVGMRCGIMDQLASCFGLRDHALLIDCRTLDVQPVPLESSRVRVVVANTMTRHALAGSAYNRRREECEEAVRRIAAVKPEVRALRDVSWEEISSLTESWPEPIRRRARHITLEIARVHSAARALERGDYETLGRLMLESHRSLNEDFEVSSPELNLMVELARELPGALGARMTGGGFGGSTVNLVRAEAVDAFAATLARHYQERAGIDPVITACRPGDGAGEVLFSSGTATPGCAPFN